MGERLTQDQVAEIRQRFGGTASADAGDLLEDMSALLDHAEATADPDDREGLVEAFTYRLRCDNPDCEVGWGHPITSEDGGVQMTDAPCHGCGGVLTLYPFCDRLRAQEAGDGDDG